MTDNGHRLSPRLEKSFLFSVAGVILFTGIYPLLLNGLRPMLADWLYLLLALVPLQAANILSCLIPARIYEPGRPLDDVLELKKLTGRQYIMIGGGTLGLYLVLAALTGLMIYGLRKIGFQPQEQALVKLFRSGSAVQIAILIPATVLLAPIGEELCFRHVFCKSLEFNCGFRTAAFLTAVIFAGAHLNLQVTPALLVLSLWLSALYRMTGSLLAAIFAHCVFNTLSVILICIHQIKF